MVWFSENYKQEAPFAKHQRACQENPTVQNLSTLVNWHGHVGLKTAVQRFPFGFRFQTFCLAVFWSPTLAKVAIVYTAVFSPCPASLMDFLRFQCYSVTAAPLKQFSVDTPYANGQDSAFSAGNPPPERQPLGWQNTAVYTSIYVGWMMLPTSIVFVTPRSNIVRVTLWFLVSYAARAPAPLPSW